MDSYAACASRQITLRFVSSCSGDKNPAVFFKSQLYLQASPRIKTYTSEGKYIPGDLNFAKQKLLHKNALKGASGDYNSVKIK